jgi:hypothetical protein
MVAVSQAVGRLQALDLEPQKDLISTRRFAINFFSFQEGVLEADAILLGRRSRDAKI